MKTLGWITLGLLAGCATTPGAEPHEMSAAGHEAMAQQEEKWTSVTNPTEASRRAAEEHRRRAAEHRAASSALRLAEARACAGIADDDRDMSPFEHTEDMVRVEPLKEVTSTGRESFASGERLAGAIVTFRAVPGMTAEWLQRLIDCHLARNASLGHVVPEMPDCPLVPKGVEARVTSTPNGFSVVLRSGDPAVAQEILARARRLMATGPVGSE